MKLDCNHLLREHVYINGQWRQATDNSTIDVINPATKQTIAQVPNLSREDAAQAVSAAHDAQADWANLTAHKRSDYLMRWHDLMLKHQRDLATILSTEQGKPLAESMGEIAYGASYVKFYAEEAKRVYGETIPANDSDQRIMVIKQPVGVAAAITPWNFPNAMITRKAAPALAAGCSFIIRPASKTPLSALALAYLAELAEFPPGVFNVITGSSKPLGELLTQDARIRKFSFTGSTDVGRQLYAQASENIAKISLELGGNAPFIVFDDADLSKAVAGAIACKFRNSGQTCVCANRIYVQEGIYEAFVEQFTAKVNALTLGEAFTDGVDLGPLIDEDAVNKANELLEDAISKGAQVVTGGQIDPDLGGTFYQPTVVREAKQSMRFAKEEIFAPVAAIYAFKDEQQAIDYANDTKFGLASYFYSRDIGRITRVYEALDYGIVGVNSGMISNAEAPFGGVKQSGLGREGSRHGIEEYLEQKYVLVAGIDPD